MADFFQAMLSGHARRMTKEQSPKQFRSTLRDYLANTTIASICHTLHPVILRHDSTVQEALHVLAQHHILSAPVARPRFGKRTGDPILSEEDYLKTEPAIDVIGIVDVRDLLETYVNLIDPKHFEGTPDVDELVSELEGFAKKVQNSAICTVVPWLQEDSATGMVRGGCDGALLTETSAKDNLVHLLECGFFDAHRQAAQASMEAEPDLAKARAAVRLVHRVALFDQAGRISGMVSQTDVIRGLAENAASFEDVKDKTLRELGMGVSSDDAHHQFLVCVPASQPTIQVLRLLVGKNGLSSVGVTDEKSGELVASISASDFRGIEADKFHALCLPVLEFIRLEHGHAKKSLEAEYSWPHPEPNSRDIPDLVAGTVDSSLIEVLNLMNDNKIHRVYLVDAQKRPAGIVTQSDILGFLYLTGRMKFAPVSMQPHNM